MKLKTSQKNHLFDAITDSDFGVAMFQSQEITDWQTATSKFIIRVNTHDFSFEISDSHGKYLLEFSPGVDRYNEEERVSDWDMVRNEFDAWLFRLEDEVNVEDKWTAFEKLIEDTSLQNDTTIANDKFTIPEYLALQEKIGLLKIDLSKLDLLPAQLNLLTDKLDIVLDQTKHLGKFDWRSFFVGTMISVILQLSLSQDQGKAIWQLIKKLFSNYFLAN